MNKETLDFRIQNIKATIERETEGLTAEELQVVYAATVPGESRTTAKCLNVDCPRYSEERLAVNGERCYPCMKLLTPVAPSTPSSLARRITEKIYEAGMLSEDYQSSRTLDDINPRYAADLAAIIESELAATSTERLTEAQRRAIAMEVIWEIYGLPPSKKARAIVADIQNAPLPSPPESRKS